MALSSVLGLTLLVVLASSSPVERDERSVLGDVGGKVLNTFGLSGAVYGGNNMVGTIENKVYPAALKSFCANNGYTEWAGQGPEPAGGGFLDQGLSWFGGASGSFFGSWLPDVVIKGKCDGAGWAKPGQAAGPPPPPAASGPESPPA